MVRNFSGKHWWLETSVASTRTSVASIGGKELNGKHWNFGGSALATINCLVTLLWSRISFVVENAGEADGDCQWFCWHIETSFIGLRQHAWCS